MRRFTSIGGTILLLLGFSYAQEVEQADSLQTDPRAAVREAVAAFEQALAGIESYTCKLDSYAKGKDGKEEHKVYEYAFVQPGYVKMKVIQGGAGEVFYDPTTGKARGRKPGLLSVVRLTLDVNDPRIRSVRGHRVDETSWFYLLDSWKTYVDKAESLALQQKGDTLLLEAWGIPPNPYDEVAMRLFLSASSHLPLQFEALDSTGAVVHRVIYDDVTLNPGLKPEDLRF